MNNCYTIVHIADYYGYVQYTFVQHKFGTLEEVSKFTKETSELNRNGHYGVTNRWNTEHVSPGETRRADSMELLFEVGANR